MLNYKPYFLPAFSNLLGRSDDEDATEISFAAKTEIRLKNTLEVALVLDNSGSMDEYGTGSGPEAHGPAEGGGQAARRHAGAAGRADQAGRQAGAVRAGSVRGFGQCRRRRTPARPGWTSRASRRSITRISTGRRLDDCRQGAEQVGGIWYKKGIGWGDEEGQMLSRFSLYRDMKVVTSHERVAGSKRVVCDEYRSNHTCRRATTNTTISTPTGRSPAGRDASRPAPTLTMSTTRRPRAAANTGIGFGDPATMFVPMFAPDEPGNHWKVTQDPDEAVAQGYNAANSWWNDDPSSNTGKTRQRNMAKYFMARPDQCPGLTKGRRPELQLHDRCRSPR